MQHLIIVIAVEVFSFCLWAVNAPSLQLCSLIIMAGLNCFTCVSALNQHSQCSAVICY